MYDTLEKLKKFSFNTAQKLQIFCENFCHSTIFLYLRSKFIYLLKCGLLKYDPLVAPLYMFRVLAIGLIIAPIEGHLGIKIGKKLGNFNHYIHHSKFNWNYGSSPMWDRIMGINYPKVTRNC